MDLVLMPCLIAGDGGWQGLYNNWMPGDTVWEEGCGKQWTDFECP